MHLILAPPEFLACLLCLQERDPQKLLQPLAQTLAEREVAVQQALFVPPDSQYFKVGTSPSASSSEVVDLSWQQSLRAVWDTLSSSRVAQHELRLVAAPTLPPLPGTAAAAAGPPAAPATRSAVLPNLRTTLDWLRRSVREAPTLRMHVLVTGSLYLVGDMLKSLGPIQGRNGMPGSPEDK